MDREKRYLKVNAAAQYLSLSPATLNKDRSMCSLRIPFIKAGKAVIYDRTDLDEWLRGKKFNIVKPNKGSTGK